MKNILIVYLILFSLSQAYVISMQSVDNTKLNEETNELLDELRDLDNTQLKMQREIDKLVKRAKQHEEYDIVFNNSRDRDLESSIDRLFESIHILERIEKCNATTHVVTRCLKDIDLHKFIKDTYKRNF